MSLASLLLAVLDLSNYPLFYCTYPLEPLPLEVQIIMMHTIS